MSLIRTALIVTVVVALLPSDRAQQERLQQSVADAAHWAVTICDRQPQTCEVAAQGWETFKAKAEFAVTVAYDIAIQRAFGDGSMATAEAPVWPGYPRHTAAGTLTEHDLEPQWRAGNPRNGF